MKKCWLALAWVPLAFGQTQTFTYTYSGLPMPIYPDDWNTVSIISLMVPKSLSVTKVTASVGVQYNGVGDLNVYLWSAAGTRTKLLERNCGGLQNIDTTFDDASPNKYSDFCPTEAGRGPFRGNEPLGNSTGENSFGLWRLGVENNGSDSKTGTFNSFSITITGTPLGPPAIGPNTIVSTSSFQGGAVAPGDQLTLVGVNLGPNPGIRADQTQTLPTNLGGTSVTFDGVAAPLYYVSDSLIELQAPSSLTVGAITHVQVKSSSGSSLSIPVLVVSTNPGVFTYDPFGSGQAKVINQDGSLNGDGTSSIVSTKPAAAGTVIQVFASGLGPVTPPIPDGTPPPTSPLSTLTLQYSATISGQAATVTWAGAAPGQPGLYQMNIRIPPRTPSGPARLVLSVDGNTSQAGVTIQIQ